MIVKVVVRGDVAIIVSDRRQQDAFSLSVPAGVVRRRFREQLPHLLGYFNATMKHGELALGERVPMPEDPW